MGTPPRHARALGHTDRTHAKVAFAFACRSDGMGWLEHSPCYGFPMLTAGEWFEAAHFSLGIVRPDFTGFALRSAVCACCSREHGDAAA